jgi:allantoinase
MVIERFDEILEQPRKYPLVFAVSVHPLIIGQPFRLRAFRDAVRHILRHRDRLWITRPGEIARYCEFPTGRRPTRPE